MVGSDARLGEDMTRTRGDALQLVGVNTRTGAAAAIGVPRDSWVPISGVGSNRVNAALYYGGPQLLGETVGNLIGIQPEYVFVTRFPFFEEMVGLDRRDHRRQPDRVQRLLPQARGLRGRAGSTSAGTTRWRSPGSARRCPGATSTARPTSSARCEGIHATIRAQGRRAGLPGARRADGDEEHAHRPVARRAVPAGRGGRPDPAGQDHQLRRPGRASATSGAPASCCRTPVWPPGWGTAPVRTPPWSPATESRATCAGRHPDGADGGSFRMTSGVRVRTSSTRAITWATAMTMTSAASDVS